MRARPGLIAAGLLGAAILLPLAAMAQPSELAALDAQVEAARARFDVPGIAIAVVRDGRVVLLRGYGQREVGGATPVDADTLFAIASITKGFTATALSMLADDGLLSLDDRVIEHLPWFRLGDAYVSREMRLRDLLVHRSGLGLGAGDLLFWPATDYDTREVVERLANVPVSGGFRERYAYDNVLYAVAQLVIEVRSGMSYADFVTQRIFAPVGMRDARINSDALRPGDNVATGHARPGFTEPLVTVPRMAWANNSAAGGIYASARDMARWMQVQLAAGALPGAAEGDAPLFSAARQRAMWSVVTPIAIPEPAVPALAPMRPQFAGYGEGWSLSDYRGHKLVWHTGGWPGMVSRMTLVPGMDLGVVVLTNQEVGAAFNAVTLHVLDAFMAAPATDWVDAYGQAVDAARGKADDDWQRHVAARAADSRPSLPALRYAGIYRDPWYGDVVVERAADDRLALRFTRTAQLVGDLEHWQHDTFIVRWRDRALNADAFASFALTPDGSIRELRMEAVSPLTDFSYDFHDLRLVPVSPEAGDAATPTPAGAAPRG